MIASTKAGKSIGSDQSLLRDDASGSRLALQMLIELPDE